jgi:PUA domain protein
MRDTLLKRSQKHLVANSYKHSRLASSIFLSHSLQEISQKSSAENTLRVYNLTKKAGEDFLNIAWSTKPARAGSPPPLKVKDLRIAELDDPSLAIIFEKSLKLYFGRRDETIYFPLIPDEQITPYLPSATVDMGAVKFVVNGANIMRPGIVSFTGDFTKGSLVVVREASHSKAIAIGRANESVEILRSMPKGQALENVHYVGDKLWEAQKLL